MDPHTPLPAAGKASPDTFRGQGGEARTLSSPVPEPSTIPALAQHGQRVPPAKSKQPAGNGGSQIPSELTDPWIWWISEAKQPSSGHRSKGGGGHPSCPRLAWPLQVGILPQPAQARPREAPGRRLPASWGKALWDFKEAGTLLAEAAPTRTAGQGEGCRPGNGPRASRCHPCCQLLQRSLPRSRAAGWGSVLRAETTLPLPLKARNRGKMSEGCRGTGPAQLAEHFCELTQIFPRKSCHQGMLIPHFRAAFLETYLFHQHVL